MIKRILSIMLVCMGCLTLWAQSTDNRYGGDFNPTNPSDPAVPDKPAVVVTYRLTLQATEGGTVSHNQSGSDFQAGTRIRLTANVNANYKFKHWLLGDEVISTSTSFYYTMPAQAVTLKAVFEFYPGAYGGDLNPSDPSQPGVSVKSYKLTASASPASRGSVSCSSSSVQVGASAYVNATANAGYRFTGWKCGDELVSTEPYYPFVMDNKDAHYTAYFEFEPSSPTDPNASSYTLTYAIGGRTYYSELLTVGTRIKPIDTPVRKGHTFNGWSVIPDTMPNRNLTINGSFTARKHELQFIVDGEEVKRDSVAYGTVVTAPEVDVTGEKAFQWNNLPAIMPDHDVVVEGVYSSVKNVIIYRVDGEEYKRVEYEEGAPIYYEIPPVKEGYTFDGWVGVPTVMPQNYVVATGSLKPSTTFNIVYIIDGMKFHTECVASGEAVSLLVPKKDGYLFEGWSETLTTMPNHDVYLVGSFRTAIFEITYMVDGKEYKKTKVRMDDAIAPEAAPAKEGYTFMGWTGLPEKMPAKDLTVTASYAVNKYKITYTIGGETIYTDSIAYGASVTAIDAPTKVGHTFSGWVGLPETMPAKDVAVTGTFVVNTYKVTYMVDGEVYKDSLYAYGSDIEPVADPLKEGHTFSGWSDIPATMPAKDVVVTGSFTINTYKITYTLDGEVIYTDSIAYGTVLPVVEVPAKVGHTFSGWGELPETMPAKDVAVTGAFVVNTYKVTYMVDGEVYKDSLYAYGSEVEPVSAPVKEGYTFSGWSEIPETMPANDIVVTGSFTVNIYKITFTLDGEVIYTDSLAYGTALPVIEVPDKEGHTFSGWIGLPKTMPAKDVEVTGSFAINSYTLSYVVDDSVTYKNVVYKYGTKITPEANPVKKGYTFSGWSEIPATMPACDVIVKGNFTINTYSVTYVIDGEVYHTDSVVYSTGTPSLEDPVKEGYTFNGWSEIPDSMPANDVTVVGSFTVNTYKITYTVDGEEYYSNMVTYGSIITPLAYPVKEGYSFSGWGDVPATMPARDITINGFFIINTYKVIYMVDGEVYYTESVVYKGFITPIEEPTKEGYTFSGWSEIPDSMPANDVTVRGSFILNAKQQDEQGLTYELNEVGNAFEVSGYTENLVEDVVIPDVLYGLPVNTIQAISLAFSEMKSLVVPASIKTVGRKAFGDSEDLLTIEWNTTIPLDAIYFSRASNYGNMLVYVADANTEFSFQGNVIVNGVAEQITLDDELPFRNIRNFTARNIIFTKNFDKQTEIGVSGGWEAMILPFDVQNVTSSTGKEMKPFCEFDYTKHIPYWLGEPLADGTFAATQSITANKPFVMQLPNSDEYEDRYNVEGEVIFSATNVTVYATTDVEQKVGDDCVMLGSYEGTTVDGYVYALNDEECTVDNETYMPGSIFVANSRDIRPFEAYVYNVNAGRAPYLRISGENATGINHSTFNIQRSTIYDLTGRKVQSTENLKGGVYIVNGRKIVVK